MVSRIESLAAAATAAGHPGLLDTIRADLYLALLTDRYPRMDDPQIVEALLADTQPAHTQPTQPGPADPAESTPRPPPDDRDAPPRRPGPAGRPAARVGSGCPRVAPRSQAGAATGEPAGAHRATSRAHHTAGSGPATPTHPPPDPTHPHHPPRTTTNHRSEPATTGRIDAMRPRGEWAEPGVGDVRQSAGVCSRAVWSCAVRGRDRYPFVSVERTFRSFDVTVR